MYSAQNIIPVREVLRNFFGVSDLVKKTGGVVVVKKGVPEVAMIPLDKFEKMQIEEIKQQAISDYKEGKSKSITSDDEFSDFAQEVRKMAQ